MDDAKSLGVVGDAHGAQVDRLAFLKIIAAVESTPPNPEQGIGRKCYAFSDVEDRAFVAAEKYVREYCEAHGLGSHEYKIETDAVGNLFVTIYGKDRERYVMSGSHLDSVANGGMYDGVAGVNAAVNFLDTAIKHRHEMKYSYRVAMWRGEESSPSTGVTCLGSRIATGTITLQELQAIYYTNDKGERVPFLDYFKDRYGADRLAALIREACEAPFIDGNCVVYEELHIEQSGVCYKKQMELAKDGEDDACVVGIVVDGIGSANRYQIATEIQPEVVTIRALPEGNLDQMCEYTITFLGTAAHSGGTPPNVTEQYTSAESWFRSDALVATARFINELKPLLTAQKGRVHLLSVMVPQQTGYTTVPAEQVVRILAPAGFNHNLNAALDSILEPMQVRVRIEQDDSINEKIIPESNVTDEVANLRARIMHDLDVANKVPVQRWQMVDAKPGEYLVVSSKALELLNIPLYAEEIARANITRARANGNFAALGTIRMTVTDFCLTPGGVKANVDMRDVRPEDMDTAKSTFLQKLEGVLLDSAGSQLTKCWQVVSEKIYVPLDHEPVDVKRRLAHELGIKNIVEMPTFPGHDASSVKAAALKNVRKTEVSMTFVAHDGISHNPRETMPEKNYLAAQRHSHAYLAEQLGIRDKVRELLAG